MRILFIIPSTWGYGEGIIALDFAERLDKQHHKILFLVSAGLKPLFESYDYRSYWLIPGLEGMNRLMVEDVIASFRPDCILVVDYLTYQLNKHNLGIDGVLKPSHRPVYFDLYGWSRTNFMIDSFETKQQEISREILDTTAIIQPCPINIYVNQADCNPRHLPYGLLHEPLHIAPKLKQHIRQMVGCEDLDKIVFLSTARWQHRSLRYPWAKGAIEALFQIFKGVGNGIRIVHVGPEQLFSEVQAQEVNYMWLPISTPDRFNSLLVASDVYVSLNVIATTLAKAVSSSIPSVLFYNSLSLQDTSAAAEYLARLSNSDEYKWLYKHTPVYPFLVWPLGWYKFLQQVQEDNPYFSTFLSAEILQKDVGVNKLKALLYDVDTIKDLKKAQSLYNVYLRQLSSPSDVIASIAALNKS